MDIPTAQSNPPAGFLRLSNEAHQLVVIDPNGVRKEVVTASEIDFVSVYAGEPSNYAAPNPATAVAASYSTTLTGANNDVVFSAVTGGSAGNDLKVVLVDPATYRSQLSISLDVSTPANPTCTISLATGEGAQATAKIETAGTDQLTVTCPVATALGYLSNAKRISVTKGNVGKADATATYVSPTITVDLAVGTGTAAVWTLTDSGTGAGSLVTLTAPTGAGIDPTTWNAYTFSSIVPAAVSQSLAIDVSAAPAIVIKLGTAANGDVVTSTSVQVAAEIKTALDTLTGKTWTAVGAVAAGVWNSFNAAQAVSTAGVVGNALTTSKNQTTAIAGLIHAIGAGSGAVFSCTNTGTHVVTVADNPSLISFTGGGASAAIITTAQNIVDNLTNPLNGFYDAATAALFTCALKGSDTGVGVVTALSVQDLAGGLDVGETSVEVLGTPAKLGRLAIWVAEGDTNPTIKMATKDDTTTAQNGWVEILAGS